MKEPDDPICRGQIHWVDWEPGRGSEQHGRRPALIVQADPINRSQRYTNTIVVAVSSSVHDAPTHVEIGAGPVSGLRETSYACCEQILTIGRERLDGLMGTAPAQAMRQVDRALKRVLALR